MLEWMLEGLLYWNIIWYLTCLKSGSVGTDNLQSLLILRFSVCCWKERTWGWFSKALWWESDLMLDLEQFIVIFHSLFFYISPSNEENKSKFLFWTRGRDIMRKLSGGDQYMLNVLSLRAEWGYYLMLNDHRGRWEVEDDTSFLLQTDKKWHFTLVLRWNKNKEITPQYTAATIHSDSSVVE